MLGELQLRIRGESMTTYTKQDMDDNYEQGFKRGVRERPHIDAAWAEYRANLSYGEFVLEWYRKEVANANSSAS